MRDHCSTTPVQPSSNSKRIADDSGYLILFLHGRPLAEYIPASEKAKPEAAPSKQSAPTEDFLAPDEDESYESRKRSGQGTGAGKYTQHELLKMCNVSK